MEGTLKDMIIDKIAHEENLRDFSQINKQWSFDEILKMIKLIPKFVVRLEHLYNLHDRSKKAKNCKTNSSVLENEAINIGTTDNPQRVNLGVNCIPKERSDFISLFKQHGDGFAWTYNDLKTFDLNTMQHVIPTKTQTKPFQRKLRKMNPRLDLL